MNSDINKWQKVLDEFLNLPKIELNRTFMQISGYPHYENVCSNLLAFFFDPENEHGLNDLCYKALLECVMDSGDIQEATVIDVEREVNCDGKRLDLVLESEQYVIGIENKIWHTLENPLDVYTEMLKKKNGNDKKTVIKIVLGVRREILSADSGWESVTYADFFEKLKPLLGYYSINAHSKYLIYLNDFIKTIEDLQENSMIDETQAKFFKENYHAITELNNSCKDYQKTLNIRVNSLLAGLEIPKNDGKVKTQICCKDLLVIDFLFSNTSIVIDTIIRPDNWRTRIWARPSKNKTLLDELVTHLTGKDSSRFEKTGILFELDLSATNDEIKERLEVLIKEVLDFMNSRIES